jgi:hypothetical protein
VLFADIIVDKRPSAAANNAARLASRRSRSGRRNAFALGVDTIGEHDRKSGGGGAPPAHDDDDDDDDEEDAPPPLLQAPPPSRWY